MAWIRSLASTFVSRDLARRDVTLDALRGLMILGMVLVNHPPPSLPIYPALTHAVWHGWTLADTIFPGFLFAVGVSIRLTLCGASGDAAAADAALVGKILRRFVILMALNFLLINFPYYLAGRLDFTGTLALIAWCSLTVALSVLFASRVVLVWLLAGALAAQWVAYAVLPLPGAAIGSLTPEANAARRVHELLFGAPSQGTPASLMLMGLPTLGAVTTTLIGVLAAPLVHRGPCRGVPWRGLLAGLALVAAGQAWSVVLPLNKTLWTASYSVFMSGIALTAYSALRAVVDGGREAWLRPLQVAGANALVVYLFAQCLQRVLVYGRLRDASGGSVRLRHYVHEQWFAPVLKGEFGSLVFALLFLAVCYVAALLLYRRRVFIKL